MKNSKQLREERAGLVAQMNDMAALVSSEKRNFTPEENEKWDKIQADEQRLLAEAETLEKIESIPKLQESRSNENRSYHNGLTRQEADLALKAMFLNVGRPESIRPEHRSAAEKAGINISGKSINFQLPEIRAFGDSPQTVTTSGGGYTIQQGAMQAIEKTMLAFSGIRGVSKILRTSGDGSIPIPTSDDTANVGRLIAINTQHTNTAISFGQKLVGAFKFSSDLLLVPTELLEDTSIDLSSYLAEALGERLGRVTNQYFTTGAGTTEPFGIVTQAGAGKVAASETALTWEELFVDLPHSVDVAYRNSGQCGYMMHDSILAVVKKMTDDYGRPIWLPSLVPGAPDTISGYPVTVNNNMASTVEADAKVALFGNFQKFLIRDVREINVKVLTERFADYDQVAYVGTYRGDSVLTNTGCVKYLAMAEASGS